MSDHYLQEPVALQFELSSNCNINCTGCVRTDLLTYDKSGNPLIEKNKFLDIELLKNVINSPSNKNLTRIEFCGSIDDPLMHPKFLEILLFLKEKKIRSAIHTNGSLRTPDYFSEIAKLTKDVKASGINFSLDGLEDTNHLYRRGANWGKIIENAKAFIDAGGNATWQFIVFPWNSHQVEEAKKLSEQMGFSKFKVRNDRNFSAIDNFEPYIEYEKNRRKLSWDEYTDALTDKIEDSEISCFTRNEQYYFISYDGKLWPCCFLHNARFRRQNFYTEYHDRFNNNYGKDWNDLYLKSFEEIINNKFYSEDLVDSWKTTTHGTGCKDRIVRCSETCSKKSRSERPLGEHAVSVFKTP